MSDLPSAEVNSLLRSGWLAFEQGRWHAAEQALHRALTLSPHHAQAWLMLVEVHVRKGDPGSGAELLTRLLQVQPGLPKAWSRLADLKEDLGLHGESEACYGKAVELQPDFVQAHYNRARLLRQLSRPDEALASLEKALQQGHADATLQAQVLQLRALLEEEAQALDQALATLDRAIVAAPRRAALHHNRGVLLQRLYRPAAALAAHDEAMRWGLDAPDAHYNRGNSLQSLGRPEEALAAYRRALVLNPQHALALYDLTRLRWRLGDPECMSELESARLGATDPSARAAIAGIQGRLLLRAERFEQAAQAYQEAAHLSDSTAAYFDGLAQAWARLGRCDQARSAHQRAVDLAPNSAAVLSSYASTLLVLDLPELAAAFAQRAIACEPNDQHAWAVLGTAWQATGDPRADWLFDCSRWVQVYDLPAPTGWSDKAAFNQALSLSLDRLHTDTDAPMDQTLRHGTQTLGDIFEQDNALLKQLRELIAVALNDYLIRLSEVACDKDHPLLGRLSKSWRMTDSWSSRLRSCGFHVPHVHPHGWISSCYYAALPPAVQATTEAGTDRAGWIHFGLSAYAVAGKDSTPLTLVRPQVGRLVLFPSYLWHGTVPFEAEEPRLTVAFDVVPG